MTETTQPPTTVRSLLSSNSGPTEVGQSWGGWLAAGGLLGALAASSCCILPLALFSLGISGAWIANFTALAPYQPYFIVGTLSILAYGFYVVYAKPAPVCADGSCARPLPSRVVKTGLWLATVLILVALSFNTLAPLFLT